MPDKTIEDLRSGALWNDFCDALRDAGSQVLARGVPADDLTRAEGYRYLTRLLRLSLEKNIEFADPDYPQFYSLSHETAKIGNDNPDNYYQNCAVDGRREYRIRGNRDPLETIPSLASLIAGVWTIYSDSADPEEVGRQWARKFAKGMQHTMAVRECMDEGQFLDLWFRDTVSQPLVEVGKIYDFLGMELTAEARAEMAQWQDFNRRELRPPHEYTLNQYGFTEEGLRQQFRAYRGKFITG